MLLALLIAAVQVDLTQHAVHVQTGRLSWYHPKDGFNAGWLSCSTPRKPLRFKWTDNHIAHRQWHLWGCGRRVVVCADATGTCALTRVMDSGPWGAYYGELKNAVKDGRWKKWVGKLEPGWKRRAVADLSHALWVELGKPRSLSQIRLYFLPKASGASHVRSHLRRASRSHDTSGSRH